MADKKYRDLHILLSEDRQARAFFDKLPQYVRDQIMERAENVNSLESLSDYADNLLRGDD